jgi:hypothetical protein
VETSQVDESFVSTATVYDVELIGNTISGRWGEGRDTAFRLVPFYPKPGEYPWPDSGTSPEEFYSDLSAIFWTMPVDAFCEPDWVCLDFEQIYSETGKWNFKVQKGLLKVHGTSFVAMDYPFAGDLDWTTLSAQCTWTLSGPIPE